MPLVMTAPIGEKAWSHQVRPGISSFAEKPEEVTDSLQPLLNYSYMHIPPTKYSTTPLYLFATAGMRLLNQTVQDAILGE